MRLQLKSHAVTTLKAEILFKGKKRKILRRPRIILIRSGNHIFYSFFFFVFQK